MKTADSNNAGLTGKIVFDETTFSARGGGKQWEMFLEFMRHIDEGKKSLYVGPDYVVMGLEYFNSLEVRLSEAVQFVDALYRIVAENLNGLLDSHGRPPGYDSYEQGKVQAYEDLLTAISAHRAKLMTKGEGRL